MIVSVKYASRSRVSLAPKALTRAHCPSHVALAALRSDGWCTVPRVIVMIVAGFGAVGVERLPLLRTAWILWRSCSLRCPRSHSCGSCQYLPAHRSGCRDYSLGLLAGQKRRDGVMRGGGLLVSAGPELWRRMVMRKRTIDQSYVNTSTAGQNWLDLERLARVEVTSEDAAHPVESALISGTGSGWRAARAGEQTIRLIFDEPVRLRRIRLLFQEEEVARTQEFVLRWSGGGGASYREIVRQQ